MDNKKVLESLKNERKHIAEFSVFGDNNWKSMDEQIRVLTHYINTGYIPNDYNDSYELVTDLVNYLRGDDMSYIEFMDWEED